MRGRDLAILIGAIVLALLLLGVVGALTMGPVGPGMMGYGPFGYGMYWWGFGMMLFMLLFWVGIIAAIVWLGAWLFRQGRPLVQGPEVSHPSALDILKERYARGEISREEYERMRQDIEGR